MYVARWNASLPTSREIDRTVVAPREVCGIAIHESERGGVRAKRHPTGQISGGFDRVLETGHTHDRELELIASEGGRGGQERRGAAVNRQRSRGARCAEEVRNRNAIHTS